MKHFQIAISRLQPENMFRFHGKEKRDQPWGIIWLSLNYYKYPYANQLRKRKGLLWLSVFEVLIHSDNGWEGVVEPSWSLHRQDTNGKEGRDSGLLCQPAHTL